jgi:hypothetical protein
MAAGTSEEVVPSEVAVVAAGVAAGVLAGVSVEAAEAEGPEDLAARGTSGAGFSGMDSSMMGVGVALRGLKR